MTTAVDTSVAPDDDIGDVTKPFLVATASLGVGENEAIGVWLTTSYVIIGVLGIIGNSIVAIVILSSKAMRKTNPNIYIMSQTSLDFLAAFILLVQTFTKDELRPMRGLGDALYCRIWITGYAFWSVLVASTFNLVAVTIERYLATICPIWYRNNFTKRHIAASLGIVWLLGFIMNLFAVIGSKLEGGRCMRWVYVLDELTKTTVGIVTGLIQFFVPIGIHVYCYGRMAWTLARGSTTTAVVTNTNPKNNGQVAPAEMATTQPKATMSPKERIRRNIFKTLASVTACFFVCWVGNQCIWMAFNFGWVPFSFFSTPFYHVSILLLFSNCCVNPFVYLARYQQFRQALRRLVGRNDVAPIGVSSSNTGDVGVPGTNVK